MSRVLVLMFATFATFATLAAAPARGDRVEVLVHGNWCGPGHSGRPGTFGKVPVDLLDAACMRHDRCISKAGRSNCGCDLAFMDELRGTDWPTEALAFKARALHDAIALAPCNGSGGSSRTKLKRAVRDWLADVESGREPPWSVLDRLGSLFIEGLRRRR